MSDNVSRDVKGFSTVRFSSRFSEKRRQIVHILYGICIIALVHFFDRLSIGVLLASLTAIGGLFSILIKKEKLKFVADMLSYFERPDDDGEFPGKGAFFFTFGCAIVLLIFQQNIALASIVILTIGDSVSHLMGVYIKKNRYSNVDIDKVKEGMLAGIFVSSIFASIYVDIFHAVIASCIVMFIEYIVDKKFKIDDNFYIPVLASIILFVLINFVG